jgi:hypothetical protein
MSSLGTHESAAHMAAIRRVARRSAHVQRAQAMLIASIMAAIMVVAVAGALLVQFI